MAEMTNTGPHCLGLIKLCLALALTDKGKDGFTPPYRKGQIWLTA